MFNLSDYPALAEHCAQSEIGYTFIIHHFSSPLKEIGDALRAAWPDQHYLLKRLDTEDGFFDVRVTRMHFHAPSEDESPAATEITTGPAFTARELATVLHGLRMIQEHANGTGDCMLGCCDHFAGTDEMSDIEIDSLCERMNMGEGQARRVVIRVENGEAEVLEQPDDVSSIIIDYDMMSSLRGEALESAIAGLPQDLHPEVREFFLGEED